MEDKKLLNEKELERVSGGFVNHKFEFGKSVISNTSIPGIDMNVVPDRTLFTAGDELDEYARRDKRIK